MPVVPRAAALGLLLLLAGPMIAGGAALGRDERRLERITSDDDPILIPRSAIARSFDPSALDVAILDPETTGSIEKPIPRLRPLCNRLAWFPDRSPDQEYQEAC